MDATAQTPDLTRELDELRRRAYGPDGDIADDPVAEARLRELEKVLRPAAATPSAPADGRADVPVEAGPLREGVWSEHAAPDSDDVPPHGDEGVAAEAGGRPAPAGDADEAKPGASIWTKRRRRIAVLALAGAVVVGVVIGWAATALSQPRPTTSLSLVDRSPNVGSREAELVSFLGSAGVTPVSLIRFASYGHVEVWGARTEAGADCLLVTGPGSQMIFHGLNCTPAGLTQEVDLQSTPGFETMLPHPLPGGSVVRFVRDGDSVDVWTAVAPASGT
jgi:hypothetical protein